MGDVSAEPSMEDILSSIKRIIAEEGEGAPPPTRTRRPVARPAARSPFEDDADGDEVLELSDPMPDARSAVAPPLAPADTIASPATMQSTRGALDQLSRLVTKPEPESDGTLEGLVRELLRPMLREWIDANLPAMVEQMVAREIAKITGQQA